MPHYIKSNSCLIATDSSPAFSTGEKLGIYFLGLAQDFNFELSTARSQLGQLGSQEFGVDSINFSPDIVANISYLEMKDFSSNSLLGMVCKPSGDFQPVFKGANDLSSNLYFFFSDLQGNDLIAQIKESQSFSGVNLLSIGNAYLTNANISYNINTLPNNNASFVCSNVESSVLTENYVKVPSINLQSGNSTGAATIFLNPLQLDRLKTGNPTGFLQNVRNVLFSPKFENLQVPGQKLNVFNESRVRSIDLSVSIDRENSYGFGSDYVFERKIKFPVRGSLSVGGIVSDYNSGDFASLMTSESKQNIEIYFRDEKDFYLSGLSSDEFVGLNETGHIIKNRTLKFDNCSLNKKSESVSVNGLFEYSIDYSFTATENGGYSYKQGEPTSFDDFYLWSDDLKRLVSSDGYSLTTDPFCRAFGVGCEVETILSADGYIMCTRDNFVYDGENPLCLISPNSGWHSIGAYVNDSDNSIVGSYSISGSFFNVNNTDRFIGYPVVARITGNLGNGLSLETGLFYNLGFQGGIGEISDLFGESPLYAYRIERDIFEYSGGSIINFQKNFFAESPSFYAPQITGIRWAKYLSPSVSDKVHILATSGNSEAVEIHWRSGEDGWKVTNGGSNSFSQMLRFIPPIHGSLGSLQTGVIHQKQFFVGPSSSPFETNFIEYYPVGYRGTGMLSGSLTGAVRDCASGLYFDEGSSTLNQTATLRWQCFNSGFGAPTGWNVYRFLSGQNNPSKIGSTSSMSYTDSTMYSTGIYGFFTSSLINGCESWTGSCSVSTINSQ